MSHLIAKQILKDLQERGLEAKALPAPSESCEIIEITLLELATESKLSSNLTFVLQPMSLQELTHPIEYWASEESLDREAKETFTHLQTQQALGLAHTPSSTTSQGAATALFQVQMETTIVSEVDESTLVELMRLAHLLNRGMMAGYFCVDELARKVILKSSGLYTTQQTAQLLAQIGQHLFFLAAHYSAFEDIAKKSLNFETWYNQTLQAIQKLPAQT